MLTRKLIVSEYTAVPDIGLTKIDVREQTYVSEDTAEKAYTAALQYWNKKGTTKDETVGVKKAFKTTMIEGQYWITVELQVL